MSKLAPPTSAQKKRPRPDASEYEAMTQEELIVALKERDVRIKTLEGECKRLKKSAAAIVFPAPVSPERIQSKAEKLRTIAYRGIKKQMKWKPSCKRGAARFAFEGMCDEPTFRAFMNLAKKDKTKGKRMEVEEFESNILGGQSLSTSIRYGYLYLRGNVNVSFSMDDSIVKITGGYGM